MQTCILLRVWVNYSPVLLPPESLIRAHTLPLKRTELARLEQTLTQVLSPIHSTKPDPRTERRVVNGYGQTARRNRFVK